MGTDRNPQTGQQALNADVNRTRLLGKARDAVGAGTLTVTLAASTGQTICITKIVASADSAMTAAATLTVTEDPSGTPNIIFDTDWPIQVVDFDFKPPLKGATVGKNMTIVFVPGGTIKSSVNVFGFYE